MHKIQAPVTSILLVDDDEDDCMVLKMALAEVDTAIKLNYVNTGIDLLKALDAIKPDLLFLDINLPKVNGLECLQQVKSSPAHRQIPVVMYSSSELPRDLREAYQAGANLYFRKPTDLTSLIVSLRTILQMAWATPDSIKEQYTEEGNYRPFQLTLS